MKNIIDALAFGTQQEIHDEFSYQNWDFTQIFGGMNGITYRAENKSSGEVLAVKMRKRDARQRALREFSALEVVQALNYPIAPKPISLHTDTPHLSGDVIISSWVDGVVLGDLSQTSISVWQKILDTLTTMHSITPQHAPLLKDATLAIQSPDDVIAEIDRRFAKLPDGQLGAITKDDIGKIFTDFKANRDKSIVPISDLRLILCDTNPSNMIHTADSIVIVDWENSGWGDPTFDIADLLVRPECDKLTDQTRQFILSYYAEKMQSQTSITHILEYEKLMLVFWLILTSNGFANNQPKRLSGTRTFTLAQTTQQQSDYLRRIEDL